MDVSGVLAAICADEVRARAALQEREGPWVNGIGFLADDFELPNREAHALAWEPERVLEACAAHRRLIELGDPAVVDVLAGLYAGENLSRIN